MIESVFAYGLGTPGNTAWASEDQSKAQGGKSLPLESIPQPILDRLGAPFSSAPCCVFLFPTPLQPVSHQLSLCNRLISLQDELCPSTQPWSGTEQNLYM